MAAIKRDTALARLSSITAGIAIGTVAAVGVLGVYVAKAFPGHHAPAPTSTGSSITGNQAPAANVGNSGNSGSGLSPASSPPQASSTRAPVTSGSS